MAFEQQEKADGPDLAKIPIAVIHGEASFYAPYAHCLIKYMEQAGLRPTWLNLGAMGIRGNGHMMMLEKNSDQIADVMEKWVSKSAKTVGELRKVTAWPGNLAVTTPDACYPESTIKVGKAGGPKRVSPKP